MAALLTLLPITEAQLAARKIGRPATDETKKKMSDARTEYWRKKKNAVLNHKVTTVERVSLTLPVYDLTVHAEDCHNFAVESGVFIHNSGYFMMPYDYYKQYTFDPWVIIV